MAAMMLMSSCGMMSGTGATTSQTQTSAVTGSSAEGQAAGRALNALYTQYKADGKYDYTNLTNIMNTMILLQNCQNLKTQVKNSDYWKSFAAGLVLGSNNMVTESISNTVTNSLSNIISNVDTTKLQEAGNNAVQAAATAKQTADSLQSLFSLFKK
jgi:hypothetical protein